MDNLNRDIKKRSLLYGLILALSLFLTSISALYIMANTTSITVVVITTVVFSFLLPVLFALILTIRMRTRNGGYWNLRQASTGIFMMFFISYLILTASNFLFTKAIDTQLYNKTKVNLIALTTKAMQKQKADENSIRIKIKDIEENFAPPTEFRVSEALRNVSFSIILIFVFSLIFAAIFKKERPVYLPREKDITV